MSYEITTPPSLPLINVSELAGSIHSAWWSPCISRIAVYVLPPSVDWLRSRPMK